MNFVTKKHIYLPNMIFVCIYLRSKQYLNMIWRKLAVGSLNTVKTLRVSGSQPKIWQKIQKKLAGFKPQEPQLFGCMNHSSVSLNFMLSHNMACNRISIWRLLSTMRAVEVQIGDMLCLDVPLHLTPAVFRSKCLLVTIFAGKTSFNLDH